MTAKHIQEAWDKLRQERDELAAQVEAMRAALINANEQLDGWRKSFPNYGDSEEVACQIDDAIALPSHAAAILRQRDARTLREAADELYSIADDDGPEHSWGPRACAYSSAADKLIAKADALERKNG